MSYRDLEHGSLVSVNSRMQEAPSIMLYAHADHARRHADVVAVSPGLFVILNSCAREGWLTLLSHDGFIGIIYTFYYDIEKVISS